MAYGPAHHRVGQGIEVLIMMCNILAMKEIAAGKWVPALQLLKIAESRSDAAEQVRTGPPPCLASPSRRLAVPRISLPSPDRASHLPRVA